MDLPAIIKKLEKTLNAGITEESQAVYLIITLRRLLEHSHETQQFRTVAFYANWIAHGALENATAKRIVLAFDNIIATGGKGRKDDTFPQFTALVGGLTFRMELTKCLSHFNLPYQFCHDNIRWNIFMNLASSAEFVG